MAWSSLLAEASRYAEAVADGEVAPEAAGRLLGRVGDLKRIRAAKR